MVDFSDNESIDIEVLKIFQVEAEEIISKLNNSLLDLEKNPKNKELILVLFRDAHSLKGAARMIGFNNVQTLAHKMEDILGLAKDSKLIFNTKISDILYKTVDMISDIIKDSTEQGLEVCDIADFNEQIKVLENIKSVENQNVNSSKETLDYNVKLLKESFEKLNSLIVNILICLMKLEEKEEPEMIDRMSNYVNKLFELFEEIGFFEIRMAIENTKLKLDIVKQGSYNLSTRELDEIQSDLANVINVLSSMYEINNIPEIDYYSYAFEKMSKSSQQYEEFVYIQKPEEMAESLETELLDDDETLGTTQEIGASGIINFADIKAKIPNLETDITDIYEIREFFEHVARTCTNDTGLKMLDEVLKVLKYSEKTNVCPNEQILMVLSSATDFLDELLNNDSDTGNFDLIYQQLEIMLQIMELNPVVEIDDKNDVEISQQNQIQPKQTKSTDFSKMFNTSEIKTLHVDSNKLDVLINQLGEVITTKIKTTKQIAAFANVIRNVKDIQKDLVKKVNYMKSIDKRLSYSNRDSRDNLSLYLKQASNSFSEDSQKLSELLNDLNNFQRMHQDDDSKLSVLIDDLNSMVKNIRVLPFATVFHFFGRMVRDIAKEKNKKVELIINGSETTADKKIIEEIKNPLIHIVRNAVDHGIESPEIRMALGKNPTGKISINASHVENKIIIEIADDGQGFDIDKIKETAVLKDFVTPEELNSMTETEIMNMIFWPGFTTGDKVTDISGRGIGLDVVKTKITQLNGHVKIFSEINQGSRIILELPVTMATLNALVIKSAQKTFAIPMSNISTVLFKNLNDLYTNENQITIIHNDKNVPLYNLSSILNLEEKENSKETKTIVIIESDNKSIGLIVDELLGDQEILHKKLAPPIQKIKNISGVTNLASGEPCLILNVQDLIKNSTLLSNKTIATKKAQLLETKANNIYANKKLLVVDDSVTTRTLTKNILSMEGFNVETVFNPVEAFKKLKQTHYDVIITDIEMPEMSGIEFLEKLKEDKLKSNIPVIVMSSNTENETREKAKSLGAVNFVEKNNFQQTNFIDFVKNLLNK